MSCHLLPTQDNTATDAVFALTTNVGTGDDNPAMPRSNSASPRSKVGIMRLRAPPAIPSWTDAPLALLKKDGHCGLLAAWVVLRHFRKRPNSAQLIEDVAHSEKDGTFTVGIAYALAKAGLRVRFHTDVDSDPKPLERRLYRKARNLGVAIVPAVTVSSLVETVPAGSLPIVFYETKEGNGHFSPLLGMRGGKLVLPHDDHEGMSLEAFERAWTAPEICRQAVVADAA